MELSTLGRMHGGDADRVRRSTPDHVNQEIDRRTARRIAAMDDGSEGRIRARIAELDREWDVERVLEVNASTLALLGLGLGLTRNRKWLIVPGIVLPFLLQHGLQGWCPPLPILRRLGVRTQREIDAEKYALLEALEKSVH